MYVCGTVAAGFPNGRLAVLFFGKEAMVILIFRLTLLFLVNSIHLYVIILLFITHFFAEKKRNTASPPQAPTFLRLFIPLGVDTKSSPPRKYKLLVLSDTFQ